MNFEFLKVIIKKKIVKLCLTSDTCCNGLAISQCISDWKAYSGCIAMQKYAVI